MSGFRTEVQLASVCKILTARAGRVGLWTDHGPTPGAQELLGKNGGPLSSSERALVLLAWVLWKTPNDPTKLKVSDIVGNLDDENLALVGSLFLAMSQGPNGVDRWIDANRIGPAGGSLDDADGFTPAE
jgi:hypothetical protein